MPQATFHPLRAFAPSPIGPIDRRSATLIAGGCLLAALVSAVLLPTLPFNDPTSWLTWAWEIQHRGIVIFSTSPSWKPLPVLLALPGAAISPDAASFSWIVIARAGALATSVLLFRVAARSGGWGGGALAAVLPWLLPPWNRAFVAAACEPLAAACLLAAIEAHLARKARFALVALAAAALMRPEAAILAAGYAAWMLARGGRRELPLIAGLVLVGAVLWCVPAALWFDDPLQAFNRASEWTRSDGWFGSQIAMNAEFPLAFIGIAALVAAGLVLGLRERDRVVIASSAVALSWYASVALLEEFGTPRIARYMLPGTVVLATVAGAGLGHAMRAAGTRRVTLVAASALAVASVAAAAIASSPRNVRIASVALQQQAAYDSAERAIAAAGGIGRFTGCRPLAASRLLAWNDHHGNLNRQLGLPTGAVRFEVAAPTIAIVTNNRIAGRKPLISGATGRRTLARSGRWRVVYVAGRTDCGRFSATTRND